MKNFLVTLISLSGLIAVAHAAETKVCSLPVVEFTTNLGIIDVQLNRSKAPASVANFTKYVNAGFYKNKIFHRVIPGFMIQGGGFDKDMNQAPTNAPVKNEADNGLKNDRYTIAMARTSDPQSATAQFFINLKDNDFLNYTSKTEAGWGYTVFGKVIKGNAVVDKIAAVATSSSGSYQDVPTSPVIIQSAKLLPCAK